MSTHAPTRPHVPATAEDPSIDPALPHILENFPDGILLMDREWRITYANRTARTISRVLPEHLNGPSHWELYPATLGTPIEAMYRQVMETGVEGLIDSFFYEPFQVWYKILVRPVATGIALFYTDVTSLHDAQVAGKSTADQLEQVLAVTTDCVIILDRTWQITYLNQRASEILAPSGNILHTNLWESYPDAVYEGSPFIEHYYRAMDQGIGSTFEAYYPAPLNIWLQIIVRPSPDGIICFFRNITEDKNRIDNLRRSEERYRVLTELSPQSLWSANPAGLVLFANQRFLDYIGHHFVPTTGEEYIRCFDPLDRDRVVEVWTHSVRTGEDYAIDARLLRASDGASRWWHLRAAPIRDADGAIQQWLGTAADVHEVRLAADKLRQQYTEIERQSRELETIYSGSPIGMALYDSKDLRLVRINDRQAEVFRLTPGEALGTKYTELTAGVPEAHALILRAAAGETILNYDLEGALDRRPEERRHWNINYSPIFNEDGTVRAIASATIETTHQKRAEAALIQSEKLAAVGRMASSIAHEINNPLEAVTNLIYIARSYAIVPEAQHFLDLADQELRRVSIITNQTLRFHKQASFPREISCDDLFATVLPLYEGRLKNSSIAVQKRKRAGQPICCFEGDIRQVLNNLVSNAIDAMPTGGRLLLRSRQATDWRSGRSGIALTIADTGSGIDAATMAHIFEAFFTTKGNQGTGLGLWISNDIVARHHGNLLLRSSRNPSRHGTVFSLFLPFEGTPTPASLDPASRPN